MSLPKPAIEIVVVVLPPERPARRKVSFPRFVTEEANRRWLEVFA